MGKESGESRTLQATQEEVSYKTGIDSNFDLHLCAGQDQQGASPQERTYR